MSLVYIVAAAPWGPIKIETAASSANMLRQVTAQPAHIEDVGSLDAGRVAAAACAMLRPAEGDEWIACRVATAIQAVKEARQVVLATRVAARGAEAAQRPPESHDQAIAAADEATQVLIAEVDEFREATKRRARRSSAPAGSVRAIRDKLGLSQSGFARAFGVPLPTIQDWEQHRSKPDQTARAFLSVIERRPDAVREALEAARAADLAAACRVPSPEGKSGSSGRQMTTLGKQPNRGPH